MEPSSQFGDVASVDLPMIPNSSENKCFAFGTCKEATSLQKDMADSDREVSRAAKIFRGGKVIVAKHDNSTLSF